MHTPHLQPLHHLALQRLLRQRLCHRCSQVEITSHESRLTCSRSTTRPSSASSDSVSNTAEPGAARVILQHRRSSVITRQSASPLLPELTVRHGWDAAGGASSRSGHLLAQRMQARQSSDAGGSLQDCRLWPTLYHMGGQEVEAGPTYSKHVCHMACWLLACPTSCHLALWHAHFTDDSNPWRPYAGAVPVPKDRRGLPRRGAAA